MTLAPANSGIEITERAFGPWFLTILVFNRPIFVVEGYETPGRWSAATMFPVSPGTHQVSVCWRAKHWPLSDVGGGAKPRSRRPAGPSGESPTGQRSSSSCAGSTVT